MTQTSIDGEAIYSSMAGESYMTELVEMYVEEMPSRIAVLEQAFSNGDREVLRTAVHQMKGAAGSYGFDPLTLAAAVLESAIRSNQTSETIQQAFDELIQACQRIRAGVGHTNPKR